MFCDRRWSWCLAAVLGFSITAAVGADKSGSGDYAKTDKLPPGARAQIGLGHFHHSGQIFSFSFSSDSKKLVTSSTDGVRVWDVATGEEICRLDLQGQGQGNPKGGPVPVPPPGGGVGGGIGGPGGIVINPWGTSAEFSPDGKTLAVSVPGKPVTIYDAESGKQVREVGEAVAQGVGTSTCFSPDGKQLVELTRNFQDKSVHLYSVESGKEAQHFDGHEAVVLCAAFSGDGKHLATASDDQSIRVWNVESGKEERSCEGHRSGVVAVAVSSDGKYLGSMGNDSTLRIWNAANGELLHTMSAIRVFNNNNLGSNGALRFSADSKVLTACAADGIHQWEAASGKEVRKPKEQGPNVNYQYAISPDEKYIARYTFTQSPHIDLLDGKTEKEIFPSDDINVMAMAISPDSKLLATGGSDKIIRLWDMKTAKEVRKIEGHTGAVGFLSFTPDGKSIVSAARDNNDRMISIWDVENGKERKSFRSGGTAIQSMTLSRDGHTLAYTFQDQQGPTLRFVDPDTQKEIHKIPMVGNMQTLGLSPDGKSCVYMDQRGQLVLSQVGEGKEAKMLQQILQRFQVSAVYSPDGQSVALVGGQDGLVHLLDPSTGNEIRSFGEPIQPGGGILPPGRGGIGGGGVAPGGPIGGPGIGIPIRVFPQITPAFSADSRTIATAGNNGVVVWEVATGKQRQMFSGGQANLNSLAFAPDGKTLVSTSLNGPVIFWDLAGATKEEKAEADKLTAKDAEQLWNDLQGDDAGKAWHAIKVLRAAPKPSLACLGEKLKPVGGPDQKKVEKLLADLDADSFDAREKAMRDLEAMGEVAEAGLRKALKDNSSLEAGKRIEELLQKISKTSTSGEKVRSSRALEVLEQIGSDDASALLSKLAGGAESASLTQQAKASLERIKASKN
jgi:WD40 repeat protein